MSISSEQQTPPLPAQQGAYWLVLRLETATHLTVGRYGRAHFPAGWYVYTGSAHGSGGIRARLGRHLRGSPRRRWHIDFLRQAAYPIGYGWTTRPASALPWECAWAQGLASMPSAFIPLHRFGASDCRAGCPAHLVGFPAFRALKAALLQATCGTMEARLNAVPLEILC